MPINWILGHKPQHCHLICAMVLMNKENLVGVKYFESILTDSILVWLSLLLLVSLFINSSRDSLIDN